MDNIENPCDQVQVGAAIERFLSIIEEQIRNE